jgi:uncharacterized protein
VSNQIPIKGGLWTCPADGVGLPQLVASQCGDCGEIFFPQKTKNICVNCQGERLKTIVLSRRGKIHSHTVVMQRPAQYRGTVPYALAWVEFPEGVRIESLLADCDFEKLRVGMVVELCIDKLHDEDGGTEVCTYKFKPVRI